MEAKVIANDEAGAVAIVMVEGRSFVHGSILDQECAKRNAEIERLRAALKECADDLAAAIEERYPLSYGDMPGRDAYPVMQRKYDRDMAPVVAARQLLRDEQEVKS